MRARFQNVYGPGEILGAGAWRGTPATVWRNVMPTFVYRALENLPLRLENGGVATRDFIYVDDIVRGPDRLRHTRQAGDVYNLASGKETTIRELAELDPGTPESRSELEVGARGTGIAPGKRFGSTAKAERALGFTARTELIDGLRETIGWTRREKNVIDACIARHADRLAESRGTAAG